MKEKINIAVIGGDERSYHAANALRQTGFDVSLLGFGKADTHTDISSAVSNADCIVLPINLSSDVIKTSDGRAISLSEVILTSKKHVTIICGGKAKKFLSSFLPSVHCFDINLSSEFVIMNSAITAEGAMGIIIECTDLAICDMKAAILGFGNVGSITAKKLSALGADVTVFARKEAARTEALKICRARDFNDIEDVIDSFDCIINTVPQRTLNDRALKMIRADACIIELASPPGGFSDIDEKYGISPINAPGLPGKCAPRSAGWIMAKAISDILKGEIQKC